MIDDRSSESIHDVLAANLRRLRIARRLSLSELARVTATSKATLSGIERGGANPTVDTLRRLADAMEVPLTDLLTQPPPGEIRIVRAGRGAPSRQDGLPRRILQHASGKAGVELAEIQLDAHRANEVPARPAGTRAHLYVHTGPMIAGPVDRYTELAGGDYMSFPADVPQLYEATRLPAHGLLVLELPSLAS
jgi:transcriptional regulator with XRE-family HTH domain